MKKYILCILIIAGCLKLHAHPQDTIRNYRMEDIVVTATRTPLPLKYTPVITRVITAADIQSQGLSRIEDILDRELAGVEFHQAGYGTTMSFQGFDARYVLILVDGERMAGETYGNIDYSRIPVTNIDRIEIVRGASSVLYGSSAMGAVVNIITRMPRKDVEVAASFRYESPYQDNGKEQLGEGASAAQLKKYRNKLDLPNTKTDLSLGFNKGKLKSLSTWTYRTVDGYKMKSSRKETRHYKELNMMSPKFGAGGIEMVNGIPVFTKTKTVKDTTIRVEPDPRGLAVSGWRDWYLGQRFDYTVNDMFRFEVSGSYSDRARYDFMTSIMDDNPMSGLMGAPDTWQYEVYRAYSLKALMEHSPGLDHKIFLSFLHDQTRRDQETGSTSVHKQLHRYNIPRLLWTWNVASWSRLTTGVEFINESLQFDLNPAGYEDVRQLNSLALYVQDELLSGQRFSFVAGLRGDWSDKFGWRATPKASAKFTAGDFSIRANYANGYRSPSLKELYMELNIPIPGSPLIKGNTNLKAETNHYASLSFDYNNSWLNTSATVSQSWFRNKIDARYVPSEDEKMVLMYDNLDKSQFGSMELITRLRIIDGLWFKADYNYIFNQNDNSSDGSTQYIFPSPHTANFGITYSTYFRPKVHGNMFRVGVNLNVKYVGPKQYEDFMTYLNIPEAAAGFIRDVLAGNSRQPSREEIMGMTQIKYYTGTYQARHKGYALVNISVDFKLGNNFEVTAGVDNIFDYQPKVVNFNSALTPGATGFVKFGFRY